MFKASVVKCGEYSKNILTWSVLQGIESYLKDRVADNSKEAAKLRKIISFALALLGAFALLSGAIVDAAALGHSKVLVAYFSRVDENYGVGYITKGNTHIVADMIAARTGADLFEIKKTEPYPRV